ncbi:hypothetical protein JOD57_001206 [Geodermatophilus bullaregiensis]|uniref:hypothetical protein n=1 Tax=Geodermatophilus bullaregiensis TaxID=1564160 RepID=UPI00195A9547|nr:hypothetical protein [Geodermatophilus bullaregiensis]MBM7805369.1 hypothetical protein [Geodermatophilus bullaregiensis]
MVVEEAHRAQRRSPDRLIDLEETAPEWTLVLVGSDLPAAAGRVPGVRGRVRGRTARFDRGPARSWLSTLHAWHPLLAEADEVLLQCIDARHRTGRRRDRAHLLRAARGQPTHRT